MLGTESKILLRSFRIIKGWRAAQHERLRILMRTNALKPSSAVVQPDDDILRMNEVCPDQVVVAVIVYVTREQRTVVTCQGIKEKNCARLAVTEADLETLIASGPIEGCVIKASIAVEVRHCERLSEVKELTTSRRSLRLLTRQDAHTAGQHRKEGAQGQCHAPQEICTLLHLKPKHSTQFFAHTILPSNVRCVGFILFWGSVDMFVQPYRRATSSSEFMKPATVTIFTRPGCHLCEEAKAAILASGCEGEFLLEEINIDDDAALRQRYAWDIPVIFINGVKVFKHRVDSREFKIKLRRLTRQ